MYKVQLQKLLTTFVAVILIAACTDKSETTKPLISGIDLAGMDNSVRPQDNYYRYANGKWLESTEIPADEVGWGSYMTLRKESLEQSRVIVEAAATDSEGRSIKKKIGDFYNAFNRRGPG